MSASVTMARFVSCFGKAYYLKPGAGGANSSRDCPSPRCDSILPPGWLTDHLPCARIAAPWRARNNYAAIKAVAVLILLYRFWPLRARHSRAI
jgi:hypothetical protein